MFTTIPYLATRYSPPTQTSSLLQSIFDHRLEGGVEQALDEGVRGVVGAGGLAVVAGGGVEGKGAGVEIDLGVEFEEGLVDGAELFGAEVAVVDDAADFFLFRADGGKGADGVEEVGVGEGDVGEVGGGAFGIPEEGAEGGQGEGGLSLGRAEGAHDELELFPEVGMDAAAAALGELAQAVGGVMGAR